jgi:hypothetical protein
MTVPPPEPTSSTAAVAGAVAVAQAHSAAQAALTDATLAAVLALWAQMDPLSWFDSWWRQRIGQQIYVLVSLAQESVASEARPYVEAVLNILNTPATISPLVPQTFAGIASDGTDLESLLSLAPVIAYARTQRYVRVLTPPSCSRCIVLAGKFYRWNEGFLRHPMCDCRHLPVTVADSDSFLADPADYFDSLEPDQQDEVFGHANAQAIRDGADISRVVNAAGSGQTWTADDGRRYTRAGTAQRRRPKNSAVGPVLRPTPNQIYRDARGNRDEAVRLLREFRYILA